MIGTNILKEGTEVAGNLRALNVSGLSRSHSAPNQVGILKLPGEPLSQLIRS
jgi:hypothetical protein